jgi:(S)-sulfolactate dehydrogenase
MRIVISEFMDEAAVSRLSAAHDTLYDKDLVDRPQALAAALARADALIVRNRTKVGRALLASGPGLKVVGRLGVGLDNIDVAACEERGIEVIPATGANALAVAEYVIGAAMLLLRGAYASTAAVAEGKWPRSALSNGCELGGKTLGIVGFGGIGRLAGRLGRALGMRVIGLRRADRALRQGLERRSHGRVRSRCAAGGGGRRHAARAADRCDPAFDRRGAPRTDEAGCNPRQHCARRRRR